jgi:hypothetical protein
MAALEATGMNVSSENLGKLRALAKGQKRSIGFLIREAIDQYLSGFAEEIAVYQDKYAAELAADAFARSKSRANE